MSEMDVHDESVEEPELAPGEVDPEAPEADAAEQHTTVRAEQGRPVRFEVPLDADEADSADQHEVVELDEDDYR